MTQIIGTIIVVALVNWYLIFPALAIILLILLIRWIYIRTGRDLKRFENLGKIIIKKKSFVVFINEEKKLSHFF